MTEPTGRTADPATEIDAAESVDDLIGETPLVRLDAFADNCFGKLEAANPYSVEDRIARAIVDAAERDGALEPPRKSRVEDRAHR